MVSQLADGAAAWRAAHCKQNELGRGDHCWPLMAPPVSENRTGRATWMGWLCW